MKNNRFKVGDKIEKPYPFYRLAISEHFPDIKTWGVGCLVHDEQYDAYRGERFYTAHGEGVIEYEVLAVVEMPGRYKSRVIFTKTYTAPDGEVTNKSRPIIETEQRFIQFVDAGHSPFPMDYEVEQE